MVVLRATQKVLRYLAPPDTVTAASDGALGDWYANRLVVDRQPLVLLLSAVSLLSIVIPGRDLRGIPARLPEIVTARLRRLAVPSRIVAAEVATLTPCVVSGTASRSIVMSMVHFTEAIPGYLPVQGWDESTLPFVEAQLGDTPCRVTARREDTIWPAREARRLLAARWDH